MVTISWDVMECNWVKVYRSFRGLYCPHVHCQSSQARCRQRLLAPHFSLAYRLTLKVEVVQSSEMSVILYQTTWYVTKDSASLVRASVS
jgi:hypothetical protein